MNAYWFVKENGLDKAKAVVEGAPDDAKKFRDMDSVCSPGEILYYKWNGVLLLVFDDGLWGKSIYHTGNLHIKDQLVGLCELKQVIADYELVASYGGLINAECELKNIDEDWEYHSPRYLELKAAIQRIEAGERA